LAPADPDARQQDAEHDSGDEEGASDQEPGLFFIRIEG
jgi:hypothetical protein